LFALEAALRLAGFGYSTHFFIPEKEAPGVLTENPKFGWRFFPRQAARVPDPVRIARQKPARTRRIFVFGESAALGDPASAYGLSRFLSVLLNDRFPGENFEVVNTAMTAINSNVILPIADDCAKLGGDCWIFYMGNNEVVGPFGAGTVFGPPAPPLPIIRASLAFRSLRTGQWFESIAGKLGKGKPVEWGGMEMMLKARVPIGDPRLERAYRNFQHNLRDSIAKGVEAGAKVVVAPVIVNLEDCPPFASTHNPNLTADEVSKWNSLYERGRAELQAGHFSSALELFNQANELDPRYAELEYCLGLAQLRLGKNAEALRAFERAAELDTLRFRCDSGLRERTTIAAAAFDTNSVRLVNTAQAFALSPTNIPGANIFLDHVHFSFHGNYLLATSIGNEVGEALALKSTKPFLSEENCRERLAFTDWDEWLIANEMLERYRRAPFTNQFNATERLRRMEPEVAGLRRNATKNLPTAIAAYRAALKMLDNDYVLHNRFGAVLEAAGDYAEAGAQWKRAVQLMPQSVDATFKIGSMAARLNQDAEAEKWFRKTLALRATSVEAHNELGLVLAAQGKTNEAVAEFKEALRLRPSFSEAHVNWGLMLAKIGINREAEEHYRTALSLNPESLAARMNLAKLLLSENKTDAAVGEYREAVNLRPDDATAHFSLGSALQDVGKIKEAQAEYEQAVRIDPGFALAQLNLGVLLANANNRAEARAHFQAAAEADPKSAEAEFYLGMTYLQDGRPAEAAIHLEKALAIDPQHRQARAYLDRLRARQKSP
jgi:tetratricopeptide (TPR) repeat protein